MSKPKTLEDFPHFIVANIRRGDTGEDGYTRFELDGRFDRGIEESVQAWFFLLFDEHRSVCVTLQSFDKETNAATLTCDEKDEPDVAGHSLAYLSRYWRPHVIWMILDKSWGWQRKQFRGLDAIAEDFEAKSVSIVDGREVKFWTKLEPVRETEGQSRHYPPASDQNSPHGPASRLVPLGWDHEHCELCNVHVDVGDFGYCDTDNQWLCEKCYEKYVVRRDLAFVDGL
jgi:hypothetical protein